MRILKGARAPLVELTENWRDHGDNVVISNWTIRNSSWNRPRKGVDVSFQSWLRAEPARKVEEETVKVVNGLCWEKLEIFEIWKR